MAADDDRESVRVVLSGAQPLEIVGRIRRDRLEAAREPWIVLHQPEVTTPSSAPHWPPPEIRGLPYLIVHRRRVAAILESDAEGPP